MDYDAQDLQSVLLYMRGRFGAGVFEDAPRMFSILLDLAPGLRRDGNVLRQMSDAGLLRELRTASETGGEHDRQRVALKSRHWLTDYLQLPDERADFYMTALQAAYGLETEKPKPLPQPVTLSEPPLPKPQPQPKLTPPKPTGNIVDSGRTGDCIWTLDRDGVLTISGHGEMRNYDFKMNQPPWENWSYKIDSVIIQYGVTQIGNYAFYQCKNLTSVKIPASVTRSGEGAFIGCTRLISVYIPDSVTRIGKCAFDGCERLWGLRIPPGVTRISQYAFRGCKRLISVSVPKQTKIERYAFDPHTLIERR